MATNKEETKTKTTAAPKAATAKTATAKSATAKTATAKPAAAKVAAAKPAAKASTATAPKKKVEVAAVSSEKKTKVESKVIEVKQEKKPAEKKVEYIGPKLKITLVRSPIGALIKQKRTLQALGLSKIRSEVIKRDDACSRGMIFVVRHLVSVEEVK